MTGGAGDRGRPAGLAVESVTVRFGALAAVDEVTLRLDPGQVLAILGPSGCGKSTLLRAVAGLETLAAGRIAFAGQDLAGVPTHQRGFAMMFQDGQLFMHTDVAGNVGYPLRLKGVRGGSLRDEVDRLLAMVDLDGYAARRPGTLSGGEQQRVALARALAAQPRLLLLDEPLSALDRTLRERLAVDLRGVLTATGTTALLVTHDHDEAATVADRMAVMRAGRVVQQGPTAEVWRSPVDAETAQFLGYPRVLPPTAVAALAAYLPDSPERAELARASGANRAVALRRSALHANGQGAVPGCVEAVAATRDGWRLDVEVAGVGLLPAVADDAADLDVGDPVRLTVRADQLAVLPAGGGDGRDRTGATRRDPG